MIIFEIIDNKIRCLYNDSSLNIKSLSTFQQIEQTLASTDEDIAFLPRLSLLNSSSVLICSDSFKTKFYEYIKNEVKTITIPEKFTKDVIDESEINKVLRNIFNINPSSIFICLPNPHVWSRVEKSLKHVLKGAGYESTTSSGLFTLSIKKAEL